MFRNLLVLLLMTSIIAASANAAPPVVVSAPRAMAPLVVELLVTVMAPALPPAAGPGVTAAPPTVLIAPVVTAPLVVICTLAPLPPAWLAPSPAVPLVVMGINEFHVLLSLNQPIKRLWLSSDARRWPQP